MNTMYFLTKPWLRKTGKIAVNPHFWIMILIGLFFVLLYYEKNIFGYLIFPFSWNLEIFEFTYSIHGILFCILTIYASLIFWWRGAVVTWLISLIIILPRILSVKPDMVSLVTNIFYLLIPLMIVIYIALELNWRDKERKVMTDREVERMNYLDQIFKAEEDERKRLAQEIHDDSIQRLAVIASNAQLLTSDQYLGRFPNIKRQVESIRDLIVDVNQDLRRLSINLRPTVLDDLGLTPALRWLVDIFRQENGINAQIEIHGEIKELSKKTSVNIFRIVQEALNNVRRHAEATKVDVILRFTDKSINVTIHDNGKGFSLPKTNSEFTTRGKLGLVGMQQRAQFIKGNLSIQSEIGKGTTIYVETGLQ